MEEGNGERHLISKRRQGKDPRTDENKEQERNPETSENGEMCLAHWLSVEYGKEVHEEVQGHIRHLQN